MDNRSKFEAYITNSINHFDLKKFFLENGDKKSNGAVGIITPNQMILTKTLDDGEFDHNPTFQAITEFIYSIPFNYDIDNQDKYYKKELFLKKHQNIYIRMFNEQFSSLFGNIKSIWIEFPDTITSAQLLFLEYIEDKYGQFLREISIQQNIEDRDPMVGFNNLNGNTILDHSFEKAIQHSKEYLLDDNKDIIEEDYIIGKKARESVHQKNG